MLANKMEFTHELHVIRAHLLHHASLLRDFEESIRFIMKTPNPTLGQLDEEQREEVAGLMKRECTYSFAPLILLLSSLDQLRCMGTVHRRILR